MPLNLPRFDRSIKIVEENGFPALPFHQWWDKTVKNVEAAFNSLESIVLDIQAAQDAADAAQTAADTAQAAATAAQNAADSNEALVSVVNSGTDTNPLSATDAGASATIVIASHSRLYPDGTSVTVDADTLTGLAYSTEYWVYYDDPTRAGGAVTYLSTTVETTAAQAGDRHLVGKVTTPAAAGPDTTGSYKRYPGIEVV